MSRSMIGENWELVTDEPVGRVSENNRLKFETAEKLPMILEEFCRIYPKFKEENWRMSACNQLDLQIKH